MLEVDNELTRFGAEMMGVEAEAIRAAAARLNDSFERAVELLDRCRGKVVTTGVGKSGIAARKLAATLTSTGCPAVFLHPAEAMHGDLGIVDHGDVIVALSNGGESEELLAVLPSLTQRNVKIIAIVGNLVSTLAREAAITLDASVEREACPLNLAPTTSVVVALALGDALAMALEKRRGFGAEDYARNHPGGRLGRRLTLRVRDVMVGGRTALPVVRPDVALADVLCEITEKGWGATCVTGEDGVLAGIITDYDVRRAFQRYGETSLSQRADAIMTERPAVVLYLEQLAFEALQLMEDRPRPISVAPVVDDLGRCQGMVRVHDLIRARL